MVILAPLLGVFIGSAAALALGPPRSDAIRRWSSDLVRLFALVGFLPAASYAALLEGDWSCLYWLSPGEGRLLLLIVLAVAGAGAVPVVFDWSVKRQLSAQTAASRLATFLPIASALAIVTIAFASRERLAHLSTTFEFQAGAKVVTLLATARGITLLAIGAIASFATFVLLHALFVVGAEPRRLGSKRGSLPFSRTKFRSKT